jgi:hypothetical protein
MGYGKVKVEDTISTIVPDKGRVNTTVTGGRNHLSPYERTRAQVYATGNKWAIENFESTHN